MPDFQPNTTIRLYQSTGVDPQNQPYFESEGAKLSWYEGRSPLSFTAQSYQRENRHYARVNAKYNSIRNCDMMSFVNDNGKTIFCNILSIEFVNPNCTEIEFQTDSMQTFIESIIWRDCWVEREMQEDDWNGAVPSFNNLLPEGLETGVLKRRVMLDGTERNWSVVVLSAYDENAEDNYNIQINAGVPIGVNKFVYAADSGGMGSLGSTIKTYAEKGRLDGILGMWVCPTRIAVSNNFVEMWTHSATVGYDNIDGYAVKNAKCFSSEFFKVELTNRQGDSVELRPEYFPNPTTMQFQAGGAFLAGAGGVLVYPNNYMEGDEAVNKTLGVVIPINVQGAWVGNAFANWVSQNRTQLASSIIGGIGTAAVVAGSMLLAAPTGGTSLAVGGSVLAGGGAAVAGTTMGVTNALHSALGTIGKVMDKSVDPAQAMGGVTTGALAIAADSWGYLVNLLFPDAAVIESIDNFFSVFGYKTCRMKKPNVNTRPYWNYVKCSPSVVSGPFNSTDRANIQAALDNGVTFWHVGNGVEIGDYSKDNR